MNWSSKTCLIHNICKNLSNKVQIFWEVRQIQVKFCSLHRKPEKYILFNFLSTCLFQYIKGKEIIILWVIEFLTRGHKISLSKSIINCLNLTLILYPNWNCQIVWTFSLISFIHRHFEPRLNWLVENVFCFFNFLHVIDIPSLRWKVLIYLRQRSNSFFFKLWQNSQDLRMSMSLSEKYHKLSKCRRNIAPPDKVWLLTNNM